MFRNSILVIMAVVLLGVGSAMAGNCNNDNFFGTYTRVDAATDPIGDGTLLHQYIYNLTLSSDGSAIQYWTGLPDFQINSGTGSTFVGSWKCKNNGQLVVTLLASTYYPTDPLANPNVPLPDVSLQYNYRYTYLFKVNNPNTLTRIQARSRRYLASEDSTNPTAGILGTLSTTPITYNRFVASDDDLTAP